MSKKKTKSKTWNGYGQYTYLEGVGKDAKPVKFLARNDEDPRIQVSQILKGPKRLEGESFEDYKMRMKVEKKMTRDYLKGYLIER